MSNSRTARKTRGTLPPPPVAVEAPAPATAPEEEAQLLDHQTFAEMLGEPPAEATTSDQDALKQVVGELLEFLSTPAGSPATPPAPGSREEQIERARELHALDARKIAAEAETYEAATRTISIIHDIAVMWKADMEAALAKRAEEKEAAKLAAEKRLQERAGKAMDDKRRALDARAAARRGDQAEASKAAE